jgi:peptide/nickel transport system substrate-binding protein
MKRPLAILIVLILCAACAEPTASPIPSPSPTPPPTPSPTPEPKRLTICSSEEPDSLYLYGTDSIAAQHVWQAIYDGPMDSRSYAYQPVILTHLPSLANGDASVEITVVQIGDRVLDASGKVIELLPGVTVEDAGGQRVTFDGTPLLMQQMVVTFTLQPDLYWSDGMLLTADDSVFSFELASDPATPPPYPSQGGGESDSHPPSWGGKRGGERTSDYRAADTRVAVWSGVPGFLDQSYWLNFWHPLPRHAWGYLSAAELLVAGVATRKPLGWGPFVVHEWVPGDHITVVRNPIYFRAHNGLPRMDEVIFRFIADPASLAEELENGHCDVITHEAADSVRAAFPPIGGEARRAGGEIEVLSSSDPRWELLAFGISPGTDYNRPDFFEDARVRQALSLCIDRQTVVSETLGAPGQVLHSYLPPEHPLYANGSLTVWGYDPEAGQKLLATVGWYDEDGDSVREAHAIPGIADGTPFRVAYSTTDDPLRLQMGQLIQTYLAACGIQVIVETMSPEAFFAPGPEGTLFGRWFDLAQFSWRVTPDPLCDLFLSSQMPDAGRWDRPNVAGFLDDEYDTACRLALEALPGSENYVTGHIESQRIFSARLPVLPLFQRLKIVLARSSVIGLSPDPTQASELWNLEQLDVLP